MAGVTETDICNMALGHIGKGTITGTDQLNSPEAKWCGEYYPNVRRTMLQEFDWSFARQVQELPLHAEDSANGNYPYQYIMPPKSVSIHRVASSRGGDREVNYELGLYVSPDGAELPVLWSDFLNPWITYTRDINSNSLMSPEFVKAFTYQLAMEIAPALSLDKKVQSLTQLYSGWLEVAKQNDANQFNDKKNVKTLWESAQGGGDYFGNSLSV